MTGENDAPAAMPGVEAQRAHEDFLEVARIAEGWKARALVAEAALAAERERCAKIADTEAARARRSKEVEVREAFTANKIAAAIRAGE